MKELEYNAADEQVTLPTWVTRPTVMVQLLVSTSFVLIWLCTEVISQHFLSFSSDSGVSISGWYPTAGLGVALLWALGLRYAWVIVPTALLGQMGVWGYELTPSLLLAMIKALTYSSAAIVLRRALPPGALPRRPMQIGAMIAAMLGCAVFTAVICVLLLSLIHIYRGRRWRVRGCIPYNRAGGRADRRKQANQLKAGLHHAALRTDHAP